MTEYGADLKRDKMKRARCIGYQFQQRGAFMNSPVRYLNAQTPKIELVIEDDGGTLSYRLFLLGQPVAGGEMLGAKLVLARALADLAVADYRRRPSDDPGPPWN